MRACQFLFVCVYVQVYVRMCGYCGRAFLCVCALEGKDREREENEYVSFGHISTYV